MFQNGEKMMLIKLKALMENTVLMHSEKRYPNYIFNTDPESKQMVPQMPGYINNGVINIYNYKSEKGGDRDTYIVIFPSDESDVPPIAETKRLLESPPMVADGKKMPLPHGEEDEKEADPNTVYVYYGSDPECEVCPKHSGGSNGLMIANVVFSLIWLVCVVLLMVKGYIMLCGKKKVNVSSPGEYDKKDEEDSYQFNQSEGHKWGENIEDNRGQEDVGDEKMDYGTNADSQPNVVLNQSGESSGSVKQEKKPSEASNEYRLNSTEKVISRNKEFF